MTKKIQSMVLVAMFSAIISIISVIPTGIYIFGVPATFQTFAFVFAGYVLGAKDATRATCIYILLGLIGVPVFSGFKGGPGALMTVTGGYIIGFLCLAFFSGLLIDEKQKLKTFLGAFIGLIICHIIGVLWFSYISKVSIAAGIVSVVAPYLIKDILSIIAAYFGAIPVRRAVKKIKKE